MINFLFHDFFSSISGNVQLLQRGNGYKVMRLRTARIQDWRYKNWQKKSGISRSDSILGRVNTSKYQEIENIFMFSEPLQELFSACSH